MTQEIETPLNAKMKLNNLILPVCLGWPHDERKKQQQVCINITLQFKTPPLGCETDQLTDTFCYAELVEVINNKINNRTFRLLEHFTAKLYEIIKQHLTDGILISVKTTKKPKIIGLSKGVSFIYGDKF